MNFPQWFLEDKPGPVGKLDVDAPEPDDEQPPKKWMIWLAILVGVFLNEVGLIWVFDAWSSQAIPQSLMKLVGLSVYVLASHRLRPTPDRSNMGWVGGLVDNPFRRSDDINRGLAYLQVFLLPGKFMAYSLAMGWFLFQSIVKKP